MKWIKIILVMLLCMGLSACGQRAVEDTPVPENTPPTVQTQPTEPEPSQTLPDEPEQGYVRFSLSDFPGPDEDYVFQGYINAGTEQQGEFMDVRELPNVVALDGASGNAGDRLSIPLRVCGEVEFCGLDLKIHYDPQLLKYEGYDNADDDLMVHCNEEKGVVLINLARVANLEDNYGICQLLFQVITTLECESTLTVELEEMVSLDGDGNIIFPPAYSMDGIARLNGKGG